jgi:threonine synthase
MPIAHTHLTYLDHLACPQCGATDSPDTIHTTCTRCGGPLLTRYDLDTARSQLDRDRLAARSDRLWNWRELLPIRDMPHVTELGEGGTPMLRACRTGQALGLANLWIKDEGLNPTGSFKARGMAVAIARAVELGQREFVVSTAGNAGGAAAAYGARAGAGVHVYMPKDAPPANRAEVEEAGAEVVLVDGLINDAGTLAARHARERGWFDLSTLREPYRVEGKKTMGYEIAHWLGWRVPDVVVYPTGGGTGLIGIWKAFEEMQALGWIDGRRPRMMAVQAEHCAPVHRAFHAGADCCEVWPGARTEAAGLRVPKPFADRLILGVLRDSGGTAAVVSDADMRRAQGMLARTEGISACLEGAATIAALPGLIQSGRIQAEECIVCLNTGTHLKEMHSLQ